MIYVSFATSPSFVGSPFLIALDISSTGAKGKWPKIG
jgi:hypothetical protein